LWHLDADKGGGVLLFLAKLKIENAKKMIFWRGFVIVRNYNSNKITKQKLKIYVLDSSRKPIIYKDV
jgi:hypothetical protein